MQHLVFIIHEKFVAYRMGNQYGTHPIGDDTVQSVIDYLMKVINFKTVEIIHH